MFDVLGVISFLFIAFCLIMCVASMFSRRINRRLWSVLLVPGLIIFFASYALDLKFDKDEPVEIDYSGIVIETPTPSPTATPSPVPSETPSPMPTETPEQTPEAETTSSPEATPEQTQTPEPEETPVSEETPAADGE